MCDNMHLKVLLSSLKSNEGDRAVIKFIVIIQFSIFEHIITKNFMSASVKDSVKPELLAPAGDWKMLSTAVISGADAVYFGIENLNMRAKAKNFTLKELEDVVKFCKEHNAATHLTMNTIIFEDEVKYVEKILLEAKRVGVDMIICWDMSVIDKCNELGLPFCVSTQASISNSSAANLYKRLGAKRVVLARECTLDKIKEIKSNTDIEIETFIHGAMCIAVSGRCFMSHSVFGNSANRGDCIQPCRREYEIYDTDGDVKFLLGEDYVMSPKDLCTINFIDQLIEAGIDSLKIEGRKRSPEYIAKVVSTYRKAIDLYFEGKLTGEIKSEFYRELEKVYNRGFSSGFYFGTPGGDNFADKYGSKATTRKIFTGKVINYYKKVNAAHIKLQSTDLTEGDPIYIIGEKTGCVETTVTSLMKDDVKVNTAAKGDEVTFICEQTIRPNDHVYKIIEAADSSYKFQ